MHPNLPNYIMCPMSTFFPQNSSNSTSRVVGVREEGRLNYFRSKTRRYLVTNLSYLKMFLEYGKGLDDQVVNIMAIISSPMEPYRN